MDILIYLAPAFLLLSIIALFWLIVRAFKWHPGWGVAVMLLSPISATAFGVSHWREEKFPFLAYITTFITAVALSVYIFTMWGGWDMLRAAQQADPDSASQHASGRDVLGFIRANLSFTDHNRDHQQQPPLELLPEEPLESQDGGADDAETAVEEETEYVGLYRKVKPKTDRYRLVYTPIKVSDAKNYVGATMKVTRRNVEEKEYRLVSASPTNMEFSQRNKYGSFTFKFKSREIEKLRVLLKEPY